MLVDRRSVGYLGKMLPVILKKLKQERSESSVEVGLRTDLHGFGEHRRPDEQMVVEEFTLFDEEPPHFRLVAVCECGACPRTEQLLEFELERNVVFGELSRGALVEPLASVGCEHAVSRIAHDGPIG